jgi:A/G-specific adenine glycosylase
MQSAPSAAAIKKFRQMIYEQCAAQPRKTMPWRETDNPYHIHVSEIMLQQTQVERVREKYEQFINTFPDYQTLAAASLRDVLMLWQGLGYNRRAMALHEAARHIVSHHHGILPRDPSQLRELPGIGHYTAAAIAAFAFNSPVLMIETNIRTVFIHCFCHKHTQVRDRELLPFIEATLDHNNPRTWYYALMDYGVMLKRQHGNPSRRSAHHTLQTPFKGSDRELRGKILKTLLVQTSCNCAELSDKLAEKGDRVQKLLDQLADEGFITVTKAHYSICGEFSDNQN